jgi:hypothetical protein
MGERLYEDLVFALRRGGLTFGSARPGVLPSVVKSSAVPDRTSFGRVVEIGLLIMTLLR